MFKSLRWQLLIWNALILLLVEIGFGAALYLKIRQAAYDEIDAELLAAARTVDGALRGLARPILQGTAELTPPPADPPGFDFFDLLRGNDFDGPPPPPPLRPTRPPAGSGAHAADRSVQPPDEAAPASTTRTTDDRPPRDNRRPPVARRPNVRQLLSLPKPFIERFNTPDTMPFMAVWAANGKVIETDRMPADVSSEARDSLSEKIDRRVEQQGRFRMVFIRGPQGSRILVGRSILDEMAKLDALRWQIATIGSGIFAVGLIGSWWLARRIVRPIARMSATAASISASNLSERIAIDDIDLELTALGNVLNDMLQRLEMSFEQQINFSADASHELRTPLTVIMTNAELALSRPRSAEDYRESLEICLRASQRMKQLVEQLLVLARADAGKLELELEPVDWMHLTKDCIALVEPLARQRGIRISLEGTPAKIYADSDRISQVVTNLLSNAIAYNHPHGSIFLKIAERSGKSMLSIEDTGVGIPPADVPRVFDRFYRVDRARSRDNGGSGLGLAIAKLIVAAHGGEIQLSSQMGQGTIVEIILPSYDSAAITAEETS